MKATIAKKEVTTFAKEIAESVAKQNKKLEELEQKRKYDIRILNDTNVRNYTLEAKMRYQLLCLKESMKEFSYWILVFILFHIIEICFVFYLLSK